MKSGRVHKKESVPDNPGKQNQCVINLPVQAKLTVGSPGDPYEKEADAVADKIMRMPVQNFVQRKCTECDEEDKKKIQRKPVSEIITPFIQTKSNGESLAGDFLLSSIQSSIGSGSSMDSSTQTFMESRFGADFSSVKIHTGGEAVQMNNELNAQAFTVGSDVYFNEGKYQPASSEGKQLLAHELTHTVQQGNDTIRRCIDPKKNDPIYDAVAKQVQATSAYSALASADKTVADNIIADSKKKAGCLYYIGKLKQLFTTPEKSAADVKKENESVTVEAVKKEKERLAKPEAAKDIDVEKKAADAVPAANWKEIAGKFGGGSYWVDNSNPANIIVKVKVFLKPTGTGTQTDVDNIKKMHDGIEKAASIKGFIVSIEFLDKHESKAFTANVHQEGWTDAENWSSASPRTLAHELFHMLAFEQDRYNYIEAHATNESMKIIDRLTWFAAQLTKPPGFDNDLSIMGSGEHPLDEDACIIAGLDPKTCVPARRKK